MKRFVVLLSIACLLCGCAGKSEQVQPSVETSDVNTSGSVYMEEEKEEIDLTSDDVEFFEDTEETWQSFSDKEEAEAYAGITYVEPASSADYANIVYEASNSGIIRATYTRDDGESGYIVEHGYGEPVMDNSQAVNENDHKIVDEYDLSEDDRVVYFDDGSYYWVQRIEQP